MVTVDNVDLTQAEVVGTFQVEALVEAVVVTAVMVLVVDVKLLSQAVVVGTFQVVVVVVVVVAAAIKKEVAKDGAGNSVGFHSP